MRVKNFFNNLTGMVLGPVYLFFLRDWIIENTLSGTVGYIKKLLLLGAFRYLGAEFGFLGILLVTL